MSTAAATVFGQFQCRITISPLEFLDPHVLSIEHVDVVTAKADADSRNPTLIVQFQCKQINCVRNKDGEVVEVRLYFHGPHRLILCSQGHSCICFWF